MEGGNHIDLESERGAIRALEDEFPGDGWSMIDLERCFSYASSPITKILVAFLIERATGDSLDEIQMHVCGIAENDVLCLPCDPHKICRSSVPLVQVISWTKVNDTDDNCFSLQQSEVLSRLSMIINSVAPHLEYPCNMRERINNGVATWDELRVAAARFLFTKNPKLSDSLELIHFLRRQPILNMAAGGFTEDEVTRFDDKFDRLRMRYPMVDILTDPAMVIIEPVGGGPLPDQVGAIIQSITTTNINPLPSGVVPALLLDPIGPPGSTFSRVFKLASMLEAHKFADMLRVTMADGNQGPPIRILVLACGAASFRIF